VGAGAGARTAVPDAPVPGAAPEVLIALASLLQTRRSITGSPVTRHIRSSERLAARPPIFHPALVSRACVCVSVCACVCGRALGASTRSLGYSDRPGQERCRGRAAPMIPRPAEVGAGQGESHAGVFSFSASHGYCRVRRASACLKQYSYKALPSLRLHNYEFSALTHLRSFFTSRCHDKRPTPDKRVCVAIPSDAHSVS
jgi:hypothetical protein